MNQFIEQNRVLLVGVLLPIIVILLFGLATVVPRFFVAPPAYDLLFATGYFGNNNGLVFQVVNGKLQTQYRCQTMCQQYNYMTQKLYLYQVKSNTVKEIQITVPPIPSNTQPYTLTIQVPETDNLQIDQAARSPDGYELINTNANSDLFGSIFFGGNRAELSISKNGNTIVIPAENRRYNYYNAKLIGWVISKKGS